MTSGVLVADVRLTKGLRTRSFESPVGRLELEATTKGICAIRWPFDDQCAQHLDPSRRVGRADRTARTALSTDLTLANAAAARCDWHLDLAVEQLTEYFSGSLTSFSVDLDPVGTPFQQDAWLVLRTIPFGQTMTYGQQARALGDPRRARAVGAANGRNPIPIVVPCHRVVGATGHLTGFAAGLDRKAWLLEHERAAVQAA